VKTLASFLKTDQFHWKYFLFAAISLLAVLADLLLKLYIIRFTNIAVIENTGISWGLGAGFLNSSLGRVLPFIIGMLLFALLYFINFPSRLKRLESINSLLTTLYVVGGALVTGGALGNLIDRLAYGYVVDYISIFGYLTMNVADLFIIVGVVLIIISFYFIDSKPEAKTKSGKIN
jgi:signal peptidase II